MASKLQITIKERVLEAVELLQKAKPGRGPSEQRIACREQACQLLASLPANWWRKLNAEDAEIYGQLLIDAER